MKVIMKQPSEKVGRIIEIRNELEPLQRAVGGCIEMVNLGRFIIICNEESKLKGMSANFKCLSDIICGPALVCGIDGENFGDVPITLDEWGADFERMGKLTWMRLRSK